MPARGLWDEVRNKMHENPRRGRAAEAEFGWAAEAEIRHGFLVSWAARIATSGAPSALGGEGQVTVDARQPPAARLMSHESEVPNAPVPSPCLSFFSSREGTRLPFSFSF